MKTATEFQKLLEMWRIVSAVLHVLTLVAALVIATAVFM